MTFEKISKIKNETSSVERKDSHEKKEHSRQEWKKRFKKTNKTISKPTKGGK